MPPPGQRPPGCAFSSRCAFVIEPCAEQEPNLADTGDGHLVRCIRSDEVAAAPAATPRRLHREVLDRTTLLTVGDFRASYGGRPVVHGLTLELERGECLAIVGGSGAGKTTVARSIAGLNREWSGDVRLEDVPLRRLARDRSREQRRQIQYIFQNPWGSLNPLRTVGDSVGMPLRRFLGLRGREQRRRTLHLLGDVHLSETAADMYPDQLSGGERQRVAIARALAGEPRLLICDEITSALDVSVQAAIVNLLEELRRRTGLTLLFVTHNLALVRSLADRVVVLDHGTGVESGPADVVLTRPAHPVTSALLRNTPSPLSPGTGVGAIGDER
jgi:peptide/nickel transport system ATP-binding protein